MRVKDKIIFGILVILIAVAGYFQYMASNMISRMDELNEEDSKHVDVCQWWGDLANLWTFRVLARQSPGGDRWNPCKVRESALASDVM